MQQRRSARLRRGVAVTTPAVVWSDASGTTAVLAGTLTANEAAQWLQANAPGLWTALTDDTGPTPRTASATATDARGNTDRWLPGRPLPGVGGRLVVRLAP